MSSEPITLCVAHDTWSYIEDDCAFLGGGNCYFATGWINTSGNTQATGNASGNTESGGYPVKSDQPPAT